MMWPAMLLSGLLLLNPIGAKELAVNGGFEQGLQPWETTAELLDDKDAARAGQWVLKAGATGRNQSVTVSRQLELSASADYQASFWLRSPDRCRAAIWAQQGKTRVQVVVVDAAGPNWRQYGGKFTVPTTGQWTIQYVLASTWGDGRAGVMFCDDLSLQETVRREPQWLSPEGELADHASLTVHRGRLWALWEVCAEDHDELAICRLTAGEPKVEQRWTVPLAGARYTLWPRLVSGPQGLWVVTAAEFGQQWDILAVPVTDDGPGRPVRVTSDADSDVTVNAAVGDDTLYLAWESNRGGQRRVWTATVKGGQASQPQVLSGPRSYRPSLVVGGPRVYAVYDRFLENHRDLCLRVLEDGAWLPEQRLTKGNRHDFNASLAWWRNSLWIAWEIASHGAYNIGSVNFKTVQVARLGVDGLEAVKGLPTGLPGNLLEQPTLATDVGGWLWLLVRKAGSQHGNWSTIGYYLDGDHWSDPRQLSAQPGWSRRAFGAAGPAGFVVVSPGGNEPNSWGTVWNSNEQSKEIWRRVQVDVAPTTEIPGPADAVTVQYADADDPKFTVAAERQRFGEDRPPFTFEYQGRQLTARWGNFHEHAELSVCNRTGDSRNEDDYVWMREVGRFDFCGVTDHAYDLSLPNWRYSTKITRACNDPERFVTFVAEEWTSNNRESKDKPGFYGHRNLIFADAYQPTWYNSKDPQYFNPQQVWDTLDGQNYIMIPHQLADTGNVPCDWNYTNDKYQPVAEIFQQREGYEAADAPRRAKTFWPGYFLQDAWAKGIKIGVIAAPDHGGGKGKAGVLVEDLTRESVLDACRARHTWGTTAAKIGLAVTVDGHLMGDAVKVDQTRPVRVVVDVSAMGPLAAIRVIRNNQIVYTHTDQGPDLHFEYVDNAPLDEAAWYYVRVERQDEELAWSSPVWLDRGA